MDRAIVMDDIQNTLQWIVDPSAIYMRVSYIESKAVVVFCRILSVVLFSYQCSIGIS